VTIGDNFKSQCFKRDLQNSLFRIFCQPDNTLTIDYIKKKQTLFVMLKLLHNYNRHNCVHSRRDNVQFVIKFNAIVSGSKCFFVLRWNDVKVQYD
jgi:hypothetical protein